MDYKLSRRNFLKIVAGVTTGSLISKYTREKSSIGVYAQKVEITDFGDMKMAYRVLGDAFDPRVNFKNNMKKLLKEVLPEELKDYEDTILEGGLKKAVLETILKTYDITQGGVYTEISEFFDVFNELSEYDRTWQTSQVDAYLKKMDIVDDELRTLVSGHLRVEEPYIPQEANTIASLLKEERGIRGSNDLKNNYQAQLKHSEHLKILLNHANKKGSELAFPKYRYAVGDYIIENKALIVFLRFVGIGEDTTEYIYPMKELSEAGLELINKHRELINQNLEMLK